MNKIYLLPNFITTGNFFSGILSICLSLQGNFSKAALWILIAMLFDFLDGQIARLSKANTKFGEEYDSLCDLVAFGVAPMILMYEMGLSRLGRFGLAIAFIYSISCALRLARYNARLDGRRKSFFVGLPAPAAGGFVASSVVAADHVQWLGVVSIAPFLMLVLSFLMISTIRYPSLHSLLELRKKGPFIYLGFSAISFGGFIFFGELCLILGFVLYVLGGLIYDLALKNRTSEVLKDSSRLEVEEF